MGCDLATVDNQLTPTGLNAGEQEATCLIGTDGFRLAIVFAFHLKGYMSQTAVRNGAGVGILFYDSIREEVRRNEFVVVKLAGIDLKSRSYIVYSKNKPLSKPAQEFLTLLRVSRHIDPVIRLGAKAQRVSSRALRGSAVA